MDSHSRSASPREPSRPLHRPPSPPTPPGVENRAFQPDEDPNHNESFTSNGPSNGVNGHSKEPNGHTDTKVPEAVNLELINLSPKNGKKKDVEVDLSASNPYDEYFVPVNEHRKYMRGEKLYVTADKRGEKSGCKRPLCWTLLALVIAAVVALIVLAATGVLFASSPTPVDQYNATVSSARALGGIALTQEQTHHDGHEDHDHDHNHNHDHSHNHDHAVSDESAKHVPGTQNDSSGESNESADSSMYVPRTVEGELKIDNEDFTSGLADPESDEYQEFTEKFAEKLKRVLFDRATLANASNDITLEIIKLKEGSIIVTYRIHWKPKFNTVANDDFITAKSMKDRLNEYLNKNSRMIDIYHIAEDKLTTRYVLDLCQINKNDCDYGCAFDETSLEFMCTCPTGEIADMANSKKCVSILEATNAEDTRQKEFRVLDENTPTTFTAKPIPEEEKPNTVSVHIADQPKDHTFDWKDNQPAKLETTTMGTDSEINFPHVFGLPSDVHSQDESETAKPEPEPEPVADQERHITHHAEPVPEPTSEPAAEPKAEPEPVAEPEPEPQPESQPIPVAEPKPEPEPTSEPEPTAEPKPETELSKPGTETHSSEHDSVSVLEIEPAGVYSTTEQPIHNSGDKQTTKPMWQIISEASNKSQDSAETKGNQNSELQAEPTPEPEPEPITESNSEMDDKSSEENQHKSNPQLRITDDHRFNNYGIETTTVPTEKNSMAEPKLADESAQDKKPMVIAVVDETLRANQKSNLLLTPESVNSNDNEWLSNDTQTTEKNTSEENHTEEQIVPKSETNYMDLIKENMNNGDTHETQQRSSNPFKVSSANTTFNIASNENITERVENKITSVQDENKSNEDVPFENLSKKESGDISDTTMDGLEPVTTTTASISILQSTSIEPKDQTMAENITNINVSNTAESETSLSNPNENNFTETEQSKNIISFLSQEESMNPIVFNKTNDVTSTAVAEPVTTEYSIQRQYQLGPDKILMEALDTRTPEPAPQTTTEKDVTDDGMDITFDAINMLFNRSSKSFMVQNNTSTEGESEKTQTTTESDWLSEAVTEVNYEQMMNNMEKQDTTETVTKIDDIMNRGLKDDFEPDYLNTLGPSKSPESDEPMYGMVHDYDNEDSRVKRVHKASTRKASPGKEETMTTIKPIVAGEGKQTTPAQTEITTSITATTENMIVATTIADVESESVSKENFKSFDKTVATTASQNINDTPKNYENSMSNVDIEKNDNDSNSSSTIETPDNKSEADKKDRTNYDNPRQENDETNHNSQTNTISSTISPIEITTVGEYVYKSNEKQPSELDVKPNLSNSEIFLANTTSAVANDPAPVWEEYEYEREPISRDLAEKVNEDASNNNSTAKEHVESSDTTTSTTTNFSVSSSQETPANDSGSVGGQHQNMTQVSNLNVTIYEVSSHKHNHSLSTSNSSSTHSTEYEDHETEMNPFLPEVENNKSLVKKLQEGHDLEVLAVNETQNENTEEHNNPKIEQKLDNKESVSIDGFSKQENSKDSEEQKSTELMNEHSNSEQELETKDESNSTHASSAEQISATADPNLKSDEKTKAPFLTFLKDTDDLIHREHKTATGQRTNAGEDLQLTTSLPNASAEDTTSKSSAEIDGDYLSVVPIEEEKILEEKELQNIHKKNYKGQNSHELNDISDSPKKSDRRTLGANNL